MMEYGDASTNQFFSVDQSLHPTSVLMASLYKHCVPKRDSFLYMDVVLENVFGTGVEAFVSPSNETGHTSPNTMFTQESSRDRIHND